MIGIGKHHFRSRVSNLLNRQRLDCGFGPDCHKGWRFNNTVRSFEPASTSQKFWQTFFNCESYSGHLKVHCIHLKYAIAYFKCMQTNSQIEIKVKRLFHIKKFNLEE